MSTAIQVENLSKVFLVRETFPGLLGTLKGLFGGNKRSFAAIKDISFKISQGERVAFIGPNGAGKSTTIKMLTGILHPTSGFIEVLGLVPWKQRTILGYQMGTVFGQRSQLWYHLPPRDTFDLLATIYDIEPQIYESRLQELIGLFEIEDYVGKPVRQLSLGERMRCELLASLLHHPKILFLDEPTIGLDINAKLMIRGLLNRIAKDQGTTLFLTSHDTADIEQVCDRVIVLDLGGIITDSPLKELRRTYMKKKWVHLFTDRETLPLSLPGVTIGENARYHFACEVDLDVTSIDRVIQETLKLTTLKDVTIENPSMEEIIRLLYKRQGDA